MTLSRAWVMAAAAGIACTSASAQMPPSSLRGPGVDTSAPGSALQRTPPRSAVTNPAIQNAWSKPGAATVTPSGLTPSQKAGNALPPGSTVLQQTNLPADLARMNDSAIIIVGGKPIAAGQVKRHVLTLDDKASIIVGGKQVPAAGIKRELRLVKPQAAASPPAQPAGANQRRDIGTAQMQAPARDTAAQRGASAAAVVPRLTPERLTIAAPRRALLLKQYQQIRAEQDRFAAQGRNVERQAPAVAANVSTPGGFAASSAALRSGVSVAPRVRTESGIELVNGREGGIRLTPGGKVIIAGRGFGASPGNVALVGGALDRQPLLLLIGKWGPEEIEAFVPGSTRGVPDEPRAALEVRPRVGVEARVGTRAVGSYRFEGVGFVAAREETTVTNGDRIALFFVVDAGPTWTWPQQGVGGVSRFEQSPPKQGIDCKRPGTDVLRFRTVNGFDVIGATLGHGRTDSGDGDENGKPGGRVFFPGYGFGAWTDEHVTRPLPGWAGLSGTEEFVSALQVNWGVFRSHTSPRTSAGVRDVSGVPSLPYVTGDTWYDSCSSNYALTSLTLYGPAGVAP